MASVPYSVVCLGLVRLALQLDSTFVSRSGHSTCLLRPLISASRRFAPRPGPTVGALGHSKSSAASGVGVAGGPGLLLLGRGATDRGATRSARRSSRMILRVIYGVARCHRGPNYGWSSRGRSVAIGGPRPRTQHTPTTDQDRHGQEHDDDHTDD